MKITKQIQRRYLDALRCNGIEDFNSIYVETAEKFFPMYGVGHGLLSGDALRLIKEETIAQTMNYWDFSLEIRNQTFFAWLLKHAPGTKTFLTHICRHGIENLSQSDHLLILNPDSDKPFKLLSLLGFFHKIPKSSIEASGKNYFLWLVKYGSVAQVIENYEEGFEFIKDEDGTPLLAYLPPSKNELREWFIFNTKILEQPLFQWLGLKLTDKSFLPRPWLDPFFEISNESFKETFNIKSKVLLKTLMDTALQPITKDSEDHQVSLSYFNAVYLLKKHLPELDENIINNALIKSTSQRWNVNVEALDRIIPLVWENLTHYSVERKLRLILTANISLNNIEDICRMIKSKAKAAEEFNLRLMPKKPKALYYIHNHLTKIPELLTENRTLISKYKDRLNNYQESELLIQYPQDEIDLIRIGLELSICVGSEFYRLKAIKGECDIFTIKEKNKIIACVEVTSYGDSVVIEQVSGRENKAVSQKYCEFIIQAFKSNYPSKVVSFYYQYEIEENY